MATGTRVRMGRTAVLDTGAMQIVISERRSEPFDLGVFTHCGIDPRRKRYVLIKSRQHFRAGFEPIARHIVLCDGDGCTQQRPRASSPTGSAGGRCYPFETLSSAVVARRIGKAGGTMRSTPAPSQRQRGTCSQ